MIQPPCPHADHFSILGVPRTFDLEPGVLETALKRLQAAAHPDRYARASAAERAHSAEVSARANAAYAVLKSPLLRARYLVSF
jgi:molecular chaperone HscB